MKSARRLALAAAAALPALVGSAASAQTASTLLYSFETLDASNFPDGFHPNGGGTTVTQNTIGATDGSHSIKYTMVTNATFAGAQTSLLPAALNAPATTAVAMDVTINPGDEFAGGFVDMGLTEFGTSNDGNNTGESLQINLSYQHSIALPAGTYRIVLPMVVPFDPFTFDSGPNGTGELIPPLIGTSSTQITASSWEFYINKGATTGANPKPNAPVTFYVDNVRAITSGVWGTDSDGDWNTAGNWFGGVPNSVDAEADLLSVITSNRTLTTNIPVTLGRIDFNQSTLVTAGYTIAGTGSIKMQTSTGSANVQVDSGTQQFNVPVEFASNSSLVMFTAGCTLTFASPVTVDNGISVVPAGPGTILYTSTIDVKPTGSITFGNSLHPTGMTMEANSNAVLSAHASGNPILVVQLDSFTPSAGSKFDLTNNEMLVSQSLTTVRGELFASNMVTSAAGRALGYADHGSGVTEVLATLLGDSDLDGTVNVADLANLAGNFGKTSGQFWISGDFDYNGNVNVADLADLAGNFGNSLGGMFGGASAAVAAAAVPEPTLSLAAGAIAMLTLRRLRSRRG
jgi:hypothetical protein